MAWAVDEPSFLPAQMIWYQARNRDPWSGVNDVPGGQDVAAPVRNRVNVYVPPLERDSRPRTPAREPVQPWEPCDDGMAGLTVVAVTPPEVAIVSPDTVTPAGVAP